MNYNPNKDIEVPSPPSDGISSLSFSPKANYLAAGSWDHQVRLWEVQSQTFKSPVNATAKIAYNHEAPVLCVAWNSDGSKVFSGSCDGKAKMFSINDPQPVQVAQHSSGIKSCFWVDELNCLVTGSWDKTLKYWDTRTPNAVHTQTLSDRVYCMDVKSPLAVVATADRNIVVFDMKKPTVEYKRFTSPLKHQSRSIACFKDKTGFAVGAIEGKVAFHYIEDKQAREDNVCYSVNAISVHPGYGTFSTAGSDGTFHYWDKDSRMRLKAFPKLSAPVSATCWNWDGSLFAYAVSYDWYQGIDGYNNAKNKNYIFLHSTPDPEVRNRKR